MKTFQELTNREKIIAILVAIREPLSIIQVLKYAGVIGELDPDDFDVFEDNRLITEVPQNGARKIMYPSEMLDLVDVDWQTVHGQIANQMMNDLGIILKGK